MQLRVLLVWVAVIALPFAAFAQSSETTPNTSACFGNPLPSWCDPNYNGGNGYPGWNDNENRSGLDPIRTRTINIAPANISKLNVHQLLPSTQTQTLAFVSLQMWFSNPQNTQQSCQLDVPGHATSAQQTGASATAGSCTLDSAAYPLTVSHLMNGAQDCPWQGPLGGSGDCASTASNSQARWNAAVADINSRGFDGVIAINQGGDNTCLQGTATSTPPGTFGAASSFNRNCGTAPNGNADPGNSEYRAAFATRNMITAMQTANNGAFSGMKVAWMEDDGAWKFATACGNAGWGTDSTDQRAFQVKCVQTKLRADFQWAHDHIWNQAQSYTSGGHPVVLVFNDVDSGVFHDSNGNDLCAGGACTLLDGTTCNSVTACWNQIWSQHKTFLQNTFGVNGAPLLIFRGIPGFSKASSDGAFLWLAFNPVGNGNQTRGVITTTTQGQWTGPGQVTADCPASTTTEVDCFYHLASTTGKFALGGAYKGFDPRYAQWYYPTNPVLSQLCGQVWVKTWGQPGNNDPATGQPFFNSTHQLPAMVANTWDDYEEGTEIQTGIDNCYTLTATQDPTLTRTLDWQIPTSSGDADISTIAEYDIFQDTSTTTFAHVAVVTRNQVTWSDGFVQPGTQFFNNRQLDVSRVISNPPNWFFVEAKGVPSVTNHLSSNVDFWPSWGSVTINGSEQSKNVGGGFYCAWYTENGDCADWEYDPGTTVYDSGTVSITVNGLTKSVAFDSSSTAASIATALASAFNADPNSSVTAAVRETSEVYFTTKLAGRNTNYSLSVSWSYDSADFSGASFWGTPSGSTMTGGIG